MKNILFRWLAALALFAFGVLYTPAYAQTATHVPEIPLAQEPLFTGRGNVHPNLILDLSVEFPTVGAAYRASYDKAVEYIGYFNPKKCYKYPNATIPVGTKTIVGPDLNEGSGGVGGSGYFYIYADANASYECDGTSFSGNFMNWAASSSIDMLRYALTGGDRTTDEQTLTVLQRAYLPDGSYNGNADFYDSNAYFPRKSITGSYSSKITPFNTSTLYIVSCRNRILFSNTDNGVQPCDAARYEVSGGVAKVKTGTDKYFGEYLARVKVCDSNEGPTRNDLCSKYGSNYKPEGTLQRYSDKVRAAAFGYLTDSYNASSPYYVDNLYGGVLRAKAKYVGPSKFEAPKFEKRTNDEPEWSATTGVFYTNPLGSDTGNSGVVNYLNKFGRTDPNRLGAYKTKDPVGEMYYESLRYLQGRQPTNGGSYATSAIRVLNGATKDSNFPVATSWSDPITASCQSNYAVVIGDVNTHQDGYIPGTLAKDNGTTSRAADSASSQWPALDVSAWSSKISAMETSTAYGNRAPRSNLNDLATRNDAGSSYGTFNMAGLAYWANTTDIRLDKPIRVKTFTIDVDEGGNGSINDDNPRTRKPRNSAFYLAAKYGGFNDRGDNTSSIPARRPDGNPFRTLDLDGITVLNNDEEWTGAKEGTDPSHYFLASQPAKMIAAIKDIFRTVSSNSGTISGVTLTSTRISTDDNSFVYQPGFDTSKWSGSLLKLKMTLQSDLTTVTIQDPKFPTWDAGEKLLPTDSRNIFTSYTEPDGTFKSVEFLYNNLIASQQAALNKSPVAPYPVDNLGQQRVNYLRGDRSNEIGQPNGYFRPRDRLLGDIVNSNPTYVGKPASYIQGAGYLDFYNANKERTPAVYVGANDGMLHAFNAETGKELFAYVPAALISDLNKLTDPSYVHRPYVDGTMNVTEAKVGGDWKTILVSGMGGGAQGLFVLDVTNPSLFGSGSRALWEFTDKDDPDMGNIYGQPIVAKFRTGTDSGGVPVYRHFVIVSNGYNSSKDDSGESNYSCDATQPDAVCNKDGLGALFMLALDKPKTQAWQRNVNYYKFTTPTKDANLPNGLSSPALVAGNDGAVRYAYAGDLQGNLWRFDFTTNDSAPEATVPWKSVRTGTEPVFTAKDSSGVRQPITQEPKVVYAPGGGFVILFGTGKFIEDNDKSSFKKQSFYAIYDTTYYADRVTGRTQLEPRTMTAYTTSAGVDAFKIAGNSFVYGTSSGTKKGWYLDFYNADDTGERSVTNALVAYGGLFFNSLLTGSNPCEKGGGRTYGLCALQGLPIKADGSCASGEVTGHISTVGMLSSPVLIETKTTVSDRDSIGRRKVDKKYAIFNFGTGGKDGTVAPAKDGSGNPFIGSLVPPAGRASWRELLNWGEISHKME